MDRALRHCCRLALVLGVVSGFASLGCGSSSSGTLREPGEPVGGAAEIASAETRLKLSFRIEVDPLATEYGPDLLRVFATVASDGPADVFPPAPPFLRLKVFEEGGDELLALPNFMRPRPEGLFPVSLEAGERVEVGPMPSAWFDLDPRQIGPDRSYRFEAEYRPGPEGAVIRETLVAKPLEGRSLWIPDPIGPTDPTRPGARVPAPLRVLDTRGRMRRYLEWSPDVGYMLAPTGS